MLVIRLGGGRRTLEADVPGLFPLLLIMSPLVLDAPPKAMRAPSRAAPFAESSMFLLPAEEGAREGLLCAPAMPQRAAVRGSTVPGEHRIQSGGAREGGGRRPGWAVVGGERGRVVLRVGGCWQGVLVQDAGMVAMP